MRSVMGVVCVFLLRVYMHCKVQSAPANCSRVHGSSFATNMWLMYRSLLILTSEGRQRWEPFHSPLRHPSPSQTADIDVDSFVYLQWSHLCSKTRRSDGLRPDEYRISSLRRTHSLDSLLYTLHCSIQYTALHNALLYTMHCSTQSTALHNALLYTMHCSTQYTALYNTLLYTMHCSTQCTALHCTALCNTLLYTMHCSTLHCSIQYTALYNTLLYTIHCSTQCTALHNALLYTMHCSMQYTALHNALLYTLHCSTYCTALSCCPTLPYTALHCPTLPYTALYCPTLLYTEVSSRFRCSVSFCIAPLSLVTREIIFVYNKQFLYTASPPPPPRI